MRPFPSRPLQNAHLRAALLACLLLGLAATPALAHKVNVFAYAEGGQVHARGYFNDGRPTVGATIEVHDEAGRLLLSGQTNDAGEFSFPVPKAAGSLKLVLVASMGHRNEYQLAASELPQPAKRPSPQAAPKPAARPPAPGTAQAAEAVAAAPPPTLDAEGLRTVVREEVERALEARLAPLTRQLAASQQQEGVSVTEVVGGVGYILGLFGVAAYFASRRRGQAKG